MDDIEKLQYANLRKCFRENLVWPILGKDYYNMAMDIYNADKFATEDLKYKFDKLERNAKLYRQLFIATLILNVLLTIFILI